MLRVRVTQDLKERFAGMAQSVTLPGEGGELVVLPGHAPLLCALGSGTLRIDAQDVAVAGGIVCVERNAVTILLR